MNELSDLICLDEMLTAMLQTLQLCALLACIQSIASILHSHTETVVRIMSNESPSTTSQQHVDKFAGAQPANLKSKVKVQSLVSLNLLPNTSLDSPTITANMKLFCDWHVL